jgi:hypothetical protein
MFLVGCLATVEYPSDIKPQDSLGVDPGAMSAARTHPTSTRFMLFGLTLLLVRNGNAVSLRPRRDTSG